MKLTRDVQSVCDPAFSFNEIDLICANDSIGGTNLRSCIRPDVGHGQSDTFQDFYDLLTAIGVHRDLFGFDIEAGFWWFGIGFDTAGTNHHDG